MVLSQQRSQSRGNAGQSVFRTLRRLFQAGKRGDQRVLGCGRGGRRRQEEKKEGPSCWDQDAPEMMDSSPGSA